MEIEYVLDLLKQKRHDESERSMEFLNRGDAMRAAACAGKSTAYGEIRRQIVNVLEAEASREKARLKKREDRRENGRLRREKKEQVSSVATLENRRDQQVA